MDHGEKQSRLKNLLRGISPDESIRSLKPAGFVVPPEAPSPTLNISVEMAQSGMDKLQRGQGISPEEAVSIEAIVLPRERPVVFVFGQEFETPDHPWEHFSRDPIKSNLAKVLPSIGRVELPKNTGLPFGGTAFVVGSDLLMTNRHVAQIFATGLGFRDLNFIEGQTAGWDPKQEYKKAGAAADGVSTMLDVKEVVLIHPYWDMAILRVSGLNRTPLELLVETPESLVNQDIAVVGYPARDWRNNLDLQDYIFGRVYNVKRLQPGKIKPRAEVESFNHSVSAMTHDSSTLGGNSGSVLIEAKFGRAVGLHFGGRYLEANYAVPMYELARDPRLRELGLKFTGAAPTNPDLDHYWKNLEGTGPESREPETNGRKNTTQVNQTQGGSKPETVSVRVQVGGRSCTIPVDLSLVSGQGEATAEYAGAGSEAVAALEAAGEPVVFPNLDKRKGYDPKFLKGFEVPMPTVTKKGMSVVALLDDGDHELRYHKFSVVMHKERRIALFTASNVDWRDHMRTINGKRPGRKELTGASGAERWITDDRIPERHQLPDLFYSRDGGAFDKGHLVRRDDVCWGTSFKDIQKGNGDTFHTTNCSPQVAGFNRSANGEDNWGDLENLVQKQAGAERVMIFSGPVLSDDDLRFEGVDKRGEVHIQIPSAFWKIVVAVNGKNLEAFGFMLEQDLGDVSLEFTVPKQWTRYMESIKGIEERLFGLASLNAFVGIDQFERLRRKPNV